MNNDEKGGRPPRKTGDYSKFHKKKDPREELKEIARAEEARKERRKAAARREQQSEAMRKAKSPESKRKVAERSLAADLEGPIRLNRFIALSGVCARREADELIAAGRVMVNGEVVKEMGRKVVQGQDKVTVNGKEIAIRSFVYLLMNKPKNKITTVKDEMDRDTVMEIVQQYTSVRVYPVGRLDRNTTGLLLFTNDGALAKKLTHPSHEVTKIYHVRLEREFEQDHMKEMLKGIELEDGIIKVDEIAYVDGGEQKEVGLRIHSGRNRIVRRMFEHFGYEITSLDRVQFGPLTKKNLPRGKCRLLTDAEIGYLKMLK